MASSIRLPILLVLCAVCAWGSGCATKRVILDEQPFSDTRLFVTRSADVVNLSWDSKPGMAYTLFFSDTRSARSKWSVLPGFDRIPGTGRRLEYTDRVPVGQARYYRLHAYPIAGFPTP